MRFAKLVLKNPALLHEHATVRDSNWGKPLSYAANLGRDRIIDALHELGATDLEWALDRAVLQRSDRDRAKAPRDVGLASSAKRHVGWGGLYTERIRDGLHVRDWRAGPRCERQVARARRRGSRIR